jgi:F-type H+-transporting ATPase subunit b
MLPQLFLLAEAAGDAPNGVTKIFDEFGIQWPFLLAQMINFAVVAFLLWRFAFRPVLATIGERQRKIESGLKYADEMKEKLAAAQQESDARIKEAQVRGQQIVAEAQKSAKEFLEKQNQIAVENAEAVLAKAQAAIALEKKKMLAEVRAEIARLVVTTTERVLSQQLSDAERGRYNESAAKELSNV